MTPSRVKQSFKTAGLLVAAGIGVGGCLWPRPADAATHDGRWSVLVITDKGDCDRAYRYPVQITNGAVGYAGQASFNVSGRVGANGAITVTVSRGDKSARGSGQLAGSTGGGAWKTGSGECSGRWTAERRS